MQSIILAADWPNCEDYEKSLQHINSPDFKAVQNIVAGKMKNLKSDFTEKLIKLHAEYLGNLKKDPAYASDEMKSKLKDVVEILDIDKTADLEDITEITTAKLDQPKKSLFGKKNVERLNEIRELALPLCDEATSLLWDKIGEADQEIKTQLVDENLPAMNRINKVKVIVPTDLETQVTNAIDIATKHAEKNAVKPFVAGPATVAVMRKLADSAKESKIELWQTVAVNVAAEILRKEAGRIDMELKTLNTIARRAREIVPNSNEMIDLFFKKFEHAFANLHKEMEVVIARWFDRRTMLGIICTNVNLEIMSNILRCLRKNTEVVARNMQSDAERVLNLASVLNNLLEMINK